MIQNKKCKKKLQRFFKSKKSPPITFLISYHLVYQCLLLVIHMPVTYWTNLDKLATNNPPPPKKKKWWLKNTAKTQLKYTCHEALPPCILKALIKG